MAISTASPLTSPTALTRLKCNEAARELSRAAFGMNCRTVSVRFRSSLAELTDKNA